jgi:hypothetical protein
MGAQIWGRRPMRLRRVGEVEGRRGGPFSRATHRSSVSSPSARRCSPLDLQWRETSRCMMSETHHTLKVSDDTTQLRCDLSSVYVHGPHGCQ